MTNNSEKAGAVANALIIGAGPGGLAAATALRQAGVEVDVAESRPDRSVLSSELMLTSPNLRALDQLGVARSLLPRGVPYPQCEIHSADNTLLEVVDIHKVTDDDMPACLGVTRRTLHDGLYEAAEAAGATIHHGTDLTSLEQADGYVEANFESGPSGRYELVVGADGGRSQVRHLVFDAREPAYVGQCAWRARVRRQGDAGLRLWYGQDAMNVYVPVDDETAFYCSLTTHESPPRLDREQFAELLLEELDEFENGLVEQVKGELNSDTHIHFAPLRYMVMPDPWYRGRVLMIGDAAHTTTPHVGYGAGLAIEDGLVLGEEVAAQEWLEIALENFMKRRYERCRKVVEAGAQLSRWQQDPEDKHSAQQAEVLDDIWLMLAEPV
jgi:2-polyprenyl-6-methoxyphenol hydroxylase-like FAD-dependent oxidoreductase